jgi:hypothetical protein
MKNNNNKNIIILSGMHTFNIFIVRKSDEGLKLLSMLPGKENFRPHTHTNSHTG